MLLGCWPGPGDAAREALEALMTSKGLQPYAWSSSAHDVYSPHSHSYNKVIYVVEGSIKFGLPQHGQLIQLNAGDRLDLPAGIVHEAKVGAQGVLCLEAQN